MPLTIQSLRALEILDSRGRPTLEVSLALSNGATGSAQVPSGASTGVHEALERRDAGTARYRGLGVRLAVATVEGEIAAALADFPAEDPAAVDRRLIELDGTPGKSRLGANALLGVSCALARALAAARGEPLWRTLARYGRQPRAPRLPVPMINILSGGLHAGHNFELQDFLAIPHGFPSYGESLHAAVLIHAAARERLAARSCLLTGVADEGGWGPLLPRNEDALEVLTRAIEDAGFQPGRQVSIAIDAAASHFHQKGQYHLRSEDRTLDAPALIALYEDWAGRYPVVSLEDGLDENDWPGWRQLTAALGSRLQIIGDDFLTTNPERLRQAIAERAANAVLVKMNQIGTLTETFEVLDLASEAGWRAVVSARSGETEDAFLADLAVASGAGQIKVGSITRSERLAKYNRLLALERDGGLEWFPDAWKSSF
ncbi:MAG: phosphopyruvate hydratase [Bryobacteraceae bacterium]|nr:phosphopyruvate hydratase [Bryobacteraceae bacterium]